MNSPTRRSGKLVLVVGGVRSGKSRFAEELASRLGGTDVLFLATAEARDEEMIRRIALHRKSRPEGWRTIEQPYDVAAAVISMNPLQPVIVLDCLTLLVSNIVLLHHPDAAAAEQSLRKEIECLLQIVQQRQTALIVVSGEVGMGLVPETSLGRLFRDLLGWSNQYLASHATDTYFMLAGLPVNASKLASTVDQAAQALASTASSGAQP